MPRDNPFNVTKAVDLDDKQIGDYWVDLPGSGGFKDLVKPTSPMPMIILGGKGSGKTHILRYCSYQVQRMRHDGDAGAGLQTEGYIGIYLRCGGLNASRFSGKGQTEEAWAALFQQYMDLWLAELFLTTVSDAVPAVQLSRSSVRVADELFDVRPESVITSAESLVQELKALRRALDVAINNAALTQRLDVRAQVTPSRLVFGLPRIVGDEVPELAGIQVLYLIDELENLSEDQQRYVNTLMREKERPASFKIGARLYGVRTYETYSAGERNREGSEYEMVLLDEHFRSTTHYARFALRLCARRLTAAGYMAGEGSTYSVAGSKARMLSLFERVGDPLEAADAFEMAQRVQRSSRPYFKRLSSKLLEGVALDVAPGVQSKADVNRIVELLTAPSQILEKANALLLYQAWWRGQDLMAAAEGIRSACASYLSAPNAPAASKFRRTLSHWKSDLQAQLLADYGLKQQYVGLEAFVDMSRGLPRNLLVVLKHVFQWASFNDERPFQAEAISVASQQRGVFEAATWFLYDAEVLGTDGVYVQDAITRVADLMRRVRFSDKPAECSLCTFTVDRSAVSRRTREMIDLAQQWSLLLRIGSGHRDKNTRRRKVKYQINSMLCPIWDLPVARRGAISLTPEEADAVFDPSHTSKFDAVLRRRVSRMMAPTFGKRATHSALGALPLT